MSTRPKELANERWIKMSTVEQLANIGSEISRAIHWRNKNNIKYTENAVIRSLELIELTIDSNTVKSHLRELTRLREAINDYFFGNNEFSSSDNLWNKYFDHFNYATRLKQNKV
ncbi:MAG: hypothetical protein HN657_01570 [Candidatus Marinimicrobia bacterium]|jgi:hypothetical protein|nr:hypothetical protein [Candidatus Neomarinimicrobiota bacterium]MBT3495914.1 hypothetical protein [Candidatus Neomarinimicrobiota bacterium]MBT3731709.1 hypothetical protein [Candidatus Neomarinimicrobiota bacterium]MBT4177107.1 hypothetical protein [Candidatus Neomarinimicrobiota bacterium]MBT4593115.1 hypothetical protein [Candidatus Neomarinimicrobiota bacterium]